MLPLSQRPMPDPDTDRGLFVDRTVEPEHLEQSAQHDSNALVQEQQA